MGNLANTEPLEPPGANALGMLDAVDNLQRHLQAYAAIEQLLTLDREGLDTHLPGVRRDNLAMLIGIVNHGLAKCCQAARDAALAPDSGRTPPALT